MARHYWFGTVDTGRAFFGVLYESSRLAAWTAPAVNARTFTFPGSFPPKSETQIVSIGPSTLTWRLEFDSLDDYWALLAKLGTTDTLTVPRHVQSHKGECFEQHGMTYVRLPGTTLLSLDADAPNPDGTIEAVGVFSRHIDPATGEVVT